MKNFLLTASIIVGLVALALYYSQSDLREMPADVPGAPISSETHELITVITPSLGGVVGSPLTVSGQARGYWFFEGSFPIAVETDAGVVVGEGYATVADGENWMTEDFVPFIGVITFTPPPAGSSGFVVLHRDNPSGLSENDDQFSLAVEF